MKNFQPSPFKLKFSHLLLIKGFFGIFGFYALIMISSNVMAQSNGSSSSNYPRPLPLPPPRPLTENVTGNTCERDTSNGTGIANFANNQKPLLSKAIPVKFSSDCHPYKKYNFGVLVHNKHFSIYRSNCLGDDGFYDMMTHLHTEGLPYPDSVVYMNSYGYKEQTKNGGRILRFFKPADQSLRDFATQQDKVLAKHGVKFFHPLSKDIKDANVYIDGYSPIEPQDGITEAEKMLSEDSAEYFTSKGVKYSGRTYKGDEEAFKNVLDIMLNPARGMKVPLPGTNEPVSKKKVVLFHCKGGIHRTGMMALAIRYLQGGAWTKKFKHPVQIEVTASMIVPKTVTIQNLAEYEYFLHNQTQFRMDNLLAIREMAKRPWFKEMQLKYGPLLNEGGPACK